MILYSFKYKEFGWKLAEIAPMRLVNLLVARNATGKTRTVRAIQNVTSFLQMKESMTNQRCFETDLVFSLLDTLGGTMNYGFKVNNGIIEREYLSVNGVVLIKRTKLNARYQATKINPPSDKLVVQVRRDKDLYPEVEQLMVWAEGVMSVSCSDINPFTIIGTGKFLNPYSFSDLVEALTPSDMKIVIGVAKELGYNIVSLNTIEATSGLKLVQLKERFVSDLMVDMQLSSGMLRTLYLLCFVTVLRHSQKHSLLLIDDLGEGLDYRRSIDLGKVIFEYCEKNGMQLIVSSNDAFLMDVVDIANWQVLRRDGSEVSSINQSKYPEMFREFRMTGLSNFDLFSSDYIDSYLSKNK